MVNLRWSVPDGNPVRDFHWSSSSAQPASSFPTALGHTEIGRWTRD
jgi:hypothetical protein